MNTDHIHIKTKKGERPIGSKASARAALRRIRQEYRMAEIHPDDRAKFPQAAEHTAIFGTPFEDSKRMWSEGRQPTKRELRAKRKEERKGK